MRGAESSMKFTEERKSKMFEVYKAIKGRKTYLVFEKGTSKRDMLIETVKYHKAPLISCSVIPGWILNDELYLTDPKKKGAVKRWIGVHSSV